MSDLRIEAELARDVLLMDVSDRLPRARPYPKRKKKIDRLVVHHSGMLGRTGLEGMFASARYAIAPKPEGRGFPGFSYTFWIPYYPPTSGPLLVYRGNADDVRSNHTTGSNDRGVAVVLQGNLHQLGHASPWQIEALEALIPWAFERYGFSSPDSLTWHSEVGKKKACPGPGVVSWLSEYRSKLARDEEDTRRLRRP